MKPLIIIVYILISILYIGNYFNNQNVSYAFDEPSSSFKSSSTNNSIVNLEGISSIKSGNIDIYEKNGSNPSEPIHTIYTSEDGSWSFTELFNVGVHDLDFIGVDNTSVVSATISIVVDIEDEQYISNINIDPSSDEIKFDLTSFNVPKGRSNSCSSCHSQHSAKAVNLLNEDSSSSIAECVWKLINTTTSP
jgi:predicted CXXCH cytochrome family protein